MWGEGSGEHEGGTRLQEDPILSPSEIRGTGVYESGVRWALPSQGRRPGPRSLQGSGSREQQPPLTHDPAEVSRLGVGGCWGFGA